MNNKEDSYLSVNSPFFTSNRHEKFICFACGKDIEEDFYLDGSFIYHFTCFKEKRIPKIKDYIKSLKETNQIVTSIGAHKANEQRIINLEEELEELKNEQAKEE